MHQSDICQSSIAQQQLIIQRNMQTRQQANHQKSLKYVSAHEIKTYEHLSQLKIYQFKQSYPTSFSQDHQISEPLIHFISQQDQHYFLIDQKKEYINHAIQKTEDQLKIKIPLNNILRQNVLKLQLSKFKKNTTTVVEYNQLLDEIRSLKFKYTITLLENSFVIKVILMMDQIQKIWKDIEIPFIQNRLTIQIHQFSNEQTDIKINNYLFHLVLKMPYSNSSYYSVTNGRTSQIDRIELISIAERKYAEPNEAYCSKECQLI